MIFANYAATLEQSKRERGGLKHKTKSKVKIELKKKTISFKDSDEL